MKLDLPKEREFEAGLWYSSSGSTYFPCHWHDELEIKVVLWGRAAVLIDAERVELDPRTQLWIAPGQEHILVDVQDDFSMWVGSFRPSIVRQAEDLSGALVLDSARTWGACRLSAFELRQLSLLCATHSSFDQPRHANVNALRILVGAFVAWRDRITSDRAPPSVPAASAHPAVLRACSLLRQGEGETPLGSLAHSCGLSPSHLSRLFKEQMGLSVVQFRNHHRIQRFIARFGDGKRLTMLEAALESFGSYAQFHRAFYQVTGYGPAEHLRRVRAGLVFPVPQGAPTSFSGRGD